MKIKEKITALFIAAAAVNSMFIAVYAEEKPRISYILAETETGTVICSENADEVRPCSALAKLMTAYISGMKMRSGELSEDTIMVSSPYANSLKGAEIWLTDSEKMALSDLLKGMLAGNANDAACTIAENISASEENFVSEMNKTAETLGMASTEFADSSGLSAESVSTASDMLLLSRAVSECSALRPYTAIYMDYLRNGETQIVNTNRLVRTYDGCTGLKYAFSDEAGHCLAVSAERSGTSYTAVLMGYDDKDEMFAKAKELLNYGFSAFSGVVPEIPEELPDYVDVKGGTSPKVRAAIEKNITVIVPNSQKGRIEGRVAVPDYVYAPVRAGDKIGEISYYLNGELIYSGNITAKSNVKAVSFKFSLSKLLKYLFEI